MKAVIMAGGKGTRISTLDATIPKPMLPLLGKPVLEYQIDCLRRQGITDITLAIGYLGDKIKNYFGDGRALNIKLSYIEEMAPLGTAGSLFYMKDKFEDDFLLINGDIIFDVDIERFSNSHKACGGLATLFTHPNDHPFDSGIIICDKDKRVTSWLHKEDKRCWYKNRVNAGLHMISPELLLMFTEIKSQDLDRDILRPLVNHGKLFAYSSPEYVKDMGTPERFFEVEKDVLSGVVQSKNLSKRQRAVFLDRDGVINKHVGFLRNIEDFILNEGAADFIREINRSGFLAVVITNQPVIARGEVSWEELDEINNKMETLLGEKGAYLDDIFVCPHHPDSGFEGERVEYKIECNCRKPKPGLLFLAAEKYNIDLEQSYMIGDSESDMLAGKAAGCKTLIIGPGTSLSQIKGFSVEKF